MLSHSLARCVCVRRNTNVSASPLSRAAVITYIQRAKVRIRVNVRVFGWRRSRGRYATPADIPLHDGSPYSHVHVRRVSLGFVHRSRAFSARVKPLTLSNPPTVKRIVSAVAHLGVRSLDPADLPLAPRSSDSQVGTRRPWSAQADAVEA
jgi:hypothetical protein